jgi:hypothetical protein
VGRFLTRALLRSALPNRAARALIRPPPRDDAACVSVPARSEDRAFKTTTQGLTAFRDLVKSYEVGLVGMKSIDVYCTGRTRPRSTARGTRLANAKGVAEVNVVLRTLLAGAYLLRKHDGEVELSFCLAGEEWRTTTPSRRSPSGSRPTSHASPRPAQRRT